MTLSPGLRKLTLTIHVASSVGWFGAVTAFLALAIAGLTSGDVQTVRGAYVAMDALGWFVIVPFCAASLISGLVQALGTTWGLVKHYWVLIKLIMTVLATAVLLIHMRPIGMVAAAASAAPLAPDDLRGIRIQLIADAVAALVVLLVALTLSIYKPRGLTAYGRRVSQP